MENKTITFNDVPEAIGAIQSLLKELVAKVNILATNAKRDEPTWFNVEELIKYLPNHPAKQTIYSWTSSRKIPFNKKGDRLLFNKADIDQWLKENSYYKSESDLEQEALLFVESKRKNNLS